MLVDRCDELGGARTQITSRRHRMPLELFPGGATQLCHHTRAERCSRPSSRATAVGVFGLWLAGRKDRRGWMIY
jgi:hypothetical protein